MQWEKIQMSKLVFYDSADIISVSGSHTISFYNLGQTP